MFLLIVNKTINFPCLLKLFHLDNVQTEDSWEKDITCFFGFGDYSCQWELLM